MNDRPSHTVVDQMVDQTLLTPLAQAAMDCPNLRIGDWQRTTLSVQGRRTIFRFAGTGYEGTTPRTWSLILKEIQAPTRDDDPDNELDYWSYWERESLVYGAGIPQALHGDVRSPRCYDVTEPVPHVRWIWLEDLHDCYDGDWPLDRYGLAAYHLGKFNGSFLVGKPMPVAPWLHDHGLRSESGARVVDDALAWLRDPSIWTHTLLRQAFPKPMLPELERLASDRERILAGAAKMPRTFCHLDAHPGNMAALQGPNGEEITVLFDWALTGYGVPGEEIGRLVWAALFDCKVAVEQAEQLEAMVIEQYLQGLNDVGWHADPWQVRYGYLMSSVLIFAFEMEAVEFACEEDIAALERDWGRSQEELIARNAQVNELLLARADKLRGMLP